MRWPLVLRRLACGGRGLAVGLVLVPVLLEAGLQVSGLLLRRGQEWSNRRRLARKSDYRVLCLGESTTYRQYPRFLEESLRARVPGKTFTVIDRGRPAVRSTLLVNELPADLDLFKPDVVVVMMGINDGLPNELVREGRGGHPWYTQLKLYRLCRFLGLAGRERIFRALSPAAAPREAALSGAASPARFALPPARIREDIRALQARAEGNPDDFQACRDLIALCFQADDLAGLEQAYARGEARFPGRFKTYEDYQPLLETYMRREESERGIALARKLIRLEPRNTQGYSSLGHFLMQRGRFGESEELFRHLSARYPSNQRFHCMLALTYLRQNRLDEARAVLEETTRRLGLRAGNDVVLNLLRLYRQGNRTGEAARVIGELVQPEAASSWLGKDFEVAQDNLLGALAVDYLVHGQEEKARATFDRAEALRGLYGNARTRANYRELCRIGLGRGVRLVCMQYPMRRIDPLRDMLGEYASRVRLLSNEKIFKDAVREEGYEALFIDQFAGDFGHATDAGCRKLAGNVAGAVAETLGL